MKKIERNPELEQRFVAMLGSRDREMKDLGLALAEGYIVRYKFYKGIAHDLRQKYKGKTYREQKDIEWLLKTLKLIAKQNEQKARKKPEEIPWKDPFGKRFLI